MDSNQNYQLQQQNQSSSGLLRFRSAPSSFLSNLTPSVINNERLLNRFASYGAADTNSISISSNDTSAASPSFQDFEENKPFSKGMNSQQQGYGGAGAGAGLPPHYPRHGSNSAAMDGYLLRQGSSPASLFSNGSFQNGFGAMKCVGNYDAVNGNNGQISPSIDRLKSQISFSSRSASSLGMLSQISEIEGEEDIGATSPDDGRQGGGNGHGFPYTSWNDTPQLSENFIGLKRGRSGNERMFSELQNGELGSQVHTLTHHLSLPKTSAEMAAMDKLLQFPDSVPCKIRAKRGCATHPRSIAERVRRTRISERMRKLQELVPNMDKQTNTSDMLDLAVDYIKDLQKQFKTLSEKRAKCKCVSTQKAETNPIA